MALTSDEEELEEVAIGSLPKWAAPEDSAREILGAFAKQFGHAREIIGDWLGTQAHASTAEGPVDGDVDYLDGLAQDRGLRRANGETDDSLRYRITTPSDAINYSSLMSLINGVLDTFGLGTAVLYDFRPNRVVLGTRDPQTGTGGTFANVTGTTYKFTPDSGFQDNRPPVMNHTRLVAAYKITFSSCASAGNDGQFTITGVDGDGCTFVNASGVAEVDATAGWRIDRYDLDDNLLTDGTGMGHSYLSRGYRIGGTYPSFIVILPTGAGATEKTAVIEALRTKKGAGVRAIVEYNMAITTTADISRLLLNAVEAVGNEDAVVYVDETLSPPEAFMDVEIDHEVI